MVEVKLKRSNEWYNKNFEYEILINEDERLELENGQEKVVELEFPATIQARLWWCGSPKLTLMEPTDGIKEVSVKANHLTHGIAVIFIPLVFVCCALLNVFYPQFKEMLIAVLVGGMVLSLGLLTIWRKSWLKINLEKESPE